MAASRRRRILLAITAPIALLLVLEIFLRLIGYGEPTTFLIPAGNRDGYIPNDRFARTYHGHSGPTPFFLPAQKPADALWIFVLGESAAHGAPDAAFGISRVLETQLRARHPQKNITVFNAAIKGINSFAIADIARECVDHGADLLLVYAGNNELIGSYGCDHYTARLPSALSRTLIRTSITLRKTRTGQLLAKLTDAPAAPQDANFFLAHHIAPDDPRRETVRANFQANLERICALQPRTKVLLSTVAVNLRDCPPYASTDTQTSSANTLYRSGQIQNSLRNISADNQTPSPRSDGERAGVRGRTPEDERSTEKPLTSFLSPADGGEDDHGRKSTTAMTPIELLQLAADRDELPFRITTPLNQTIRTLAHDTGITLIDPATALPPDETTFLDHVHFAFHGTLKLARILLPQIETTLALKPPPDAPQPTDEQIAARLAYTEWDELKLRGVIARFLAKPPSTLQLDAPARLATAQNRVVNLQQRLTGPRLDACFQTYAAALARNPDDIHLIQNHAELLEATGRHAEAAAEWNRAAILFPRHELFTNQRDANLAKSRR